MPIFCSSGVASMSGRRTRLHRQAQALLPVCVIPDVSVLPSSPPIAAVNRSARPGVIELEIAGAQLRLRGTVDEAMLSSVLRALRRSE